MKSYSQRDPLWANRTIGSTQQTLGKVGCAITAIADISTYFGSNYTPAMVEHTAHFNSNAEILWASCDFLDFKFVSRDASFIAEHINAAMKDPQMAVILCVAGGSHWVAPLRWNWLFNCWTICDPWFGDVSTMRRYKNDIVGAAFFRRK